MLVDLGVDAEALALADNFGHEVTLLIDLVEDLVVANVVGLLAENFDAGVFVADWFHR